jgi:hypothetical protein
MANKKISQLVGIGTGSTVSGTFLLPVGAGSSTGPYTTNKITTSELASYIFTGDSGGGGFPATNLSGQKDVYFNNPNWQDTTSAADGTNYAYLMVKAANGLLTTGSGIARPVGGDNLGNHTATTTLNMQDENIGNVGAEIGFEDGGNIGSTVGGISIVHGTKLSLTAPEVELTALTEIDINGSVNARSANFEGTITGDALEIDGPASMKVNPLSTANIDCDVASFHYRTVSSAVLPFNLTNVTPGQTVTVAVKNSNAVSNFITTSFQSGNGSNKVQWDEANFSLYQNTSGCPGITGSRSNVYTFISLGDQLFGSAVTGFKTP